MVQYKDCSKSELETLKAELTKEYEDIKNLDLKLDMSRGKPGTNQLELSADMLGVLQDFSDLMAEDGTNCANYGVLEGIPEVRRMMADFLDVDPKNVFIGGNSSLNLMHDCVTFGYVHGFPNSPLPWRKEDNVKFLCPSPGYDRHFAITEHFGFELVLVDMTDEGPDMDQIEELVKDPEVKGMWCVPKYSNPTGITYSDETIKRLAKLETAAPDFKIFWDNAYAVHHLYDDNQDQLLNVMAELEKNGKEDMIVMFTSTSKVTFPGAGISAVAVSDTNFAWLKKHMALQTISYDKINQLRHAKYFPNMDSVKEHMKKHAELIRPKFEVVLNALDDLDGLGIASWNNPVGGYFISLDVVEGCAKRIVQLCKEAGVVLTPAGATHPYGKDPQDKTIRIAPTFPPIDELKQATALLCLCVRLAAVEKYLG